MGKTALGTIVQLARHGLIRAGQPTIFPEINQDIKANANRALTGEKLEPIRTGKVGMLIDLPADTSFKTTVRDKQARYIDGCIKIEAFKRLLANKDEKAALATRLDEIENEIRADLKEPFHAEHKPRDQARKLALVAAA